LGIFDRRVSTAHPNDHIMKSGLLITTLLAVATSALSAEVLVSDANALRAELRRAKPGTTIKLAPGNYGNKLWVAKVNGTKDKPIVIVGADAEKPPLFRGGHEAIHLSDCNYVTLRNIRISGSTDNGINADDGGTFDTPSRGLVFENITIEDIGPKGNHDGLKLSGVDDFVVRNCKFEGWGGSAIDMVGCHKGVIEKCRFVGKKGHSIWTGVQVKGGSEDILIRQNFFKDAGDRAINLGGISGLSCFRPEPRDYEARAIEVTGNHFVGSEAPIAYVTSTDCVVRQNTFIHPRKWIMRILQEQPTDKFKPCRKGIFESNLIVFDKRVRIFVNVGRNTDPASFIFRKNAWFCSDGNRRPSLPAKETDSIYQVDPQLENAGQFDIKIKSKDPRLKDIGAHAAKS
jgi:hypothetical protein